MNLKDKIKDIRNARENNKLVIFVGAGVSKNSNLPTWGELIKVFADELKINKCSTCNFKDKGICADDCKEKYNFSQDEFLRIPQYYYDNDGSIDHERYKNIIKEKLSVAAEPNEIDNIILELLPDHIITTNYDTLLENANSLNARLYNCVYKDEDLLKQGNNHYIIKMHGDINDLDSIVLKESDYISYSQSHVLIETKIKSLLIDHTFLFVGYSLNDYNLKLILGWIDYLAKENEVFDERPKNYIIQLGDTNTEEYVESYLKGNNIFVINTNDLPKEISEKNKNVQLNEYGRPVYACLDYILESENDNLIEPLIDILLEKFTIFNNFNRISYEDLINVHSFGGTKLIGTLLEFYDEKKYNAIKLILSANDTNSKSLKKIFNKAGIGYLFYRSGYNRDQVKIDVDDESNIRSKLFSLYLDNDYSEIAHILNGLENYDLKTYYYYLINQGTLNNNSNYKNMLDDWKKGIMNNKNVYDFIVYTFNSISYKRTSFESADKEWKKVEQIIDQLSEKEKKAYKFMRKMLFGNSENLFKQQKLFEKHEAIYLNKNGSTFWGNAFVNLFELQGYAYDYYFYFKYNCLTIDYYSDPRDNLKYYLKAMLCTYTPLKNLKSSNMFLGTGTTLKEYEFNEIDLDILIKYTNKKDLFHWINEYKIEYIKLDKNLDINKILLKFKNLCNTMMEYGNILQYEHIYNFCLVICRLQLDTQERKAIVLQLINILNSCIGELNGFIANILDSILLVAEEFIDDKILEFGRILEIVAKYEIYVEANSRHVLSHWKKLINLLSIYKGEAVYKEIDAVFSLNIENKQKLDYLLNVRKNFSENQISKYKELLFKKELRSISYDEIFWLICDGVLDYDEDIKDRYMSIIKEEIKMRSDNLGIKTFPDHLEGCINNIIILNLINKIEDISFLKEYRECSNYLKFIFTNDDFDYSVIDTNDYMWMNFIRNRKYREVILEHKDRLDIEKLKKYVKNGRANEGEKKFLYKYILTDEEIWKD